VNTIDATSNATPEVIYDDRFAACSGLTNSDTECISVPFGCRSSCTIFAKASSFATELQACSDPQRRYVVNRTRFSWSRVNSIVPPEEAKQSYLPQATHLFPASFQQFRPSVPFPKNLQKQLGTAEPRLCLSIANRKRLISQASFPAGWHQVRARTDLSPRTQIVKGDWALARLSLASR